MSKVLDSVDTMRDDLRALHKKIDAETPQREAQLRSALQDAGQRAQQYADSLKAIAKQQRTDASDRLAQAAAELEAAAKNAKDVSAKNAQALRESQQAMLARTRVALQRVSESIAAKRAEFKKQTV